MTRNTKLESTERQCSCKVGRVAERFDLSNLNDELISLRNDDASLRDLAAYFNRRVLEEAISDIDQTQLYGAVNAEDGIENIYQAISGDDVAADQAARTRTRLEQAGLDVDDLTDNWVSHPTVGKHLNECLNIDTSHSSSITRKDGIDIIEWSRTRCEQVVSRTLERLSKKNLVTVGELNVDVTIRINCTMCNSTLHPVQFIREGGCRCKAESSTDTGA